jgi:hypothetical protein
MKKLQLLFAAMLIGLTSATASEIVSEKSGKDLTITKRYRYTQPILFVERGVEFLIFPDGSFDFNTEYGNWSNDDYYTKGKRSRRGSINRAFSAPGSRVNYTSSRHRGNRGVRVIHDRWGNVRRVGNVFINYDWNGRVKRVGSVYMRYRWDRLTQVGGLRLIYGRHGRLIDMRGHVNYHNDGCGFCGITGCSADHFDNGRGLDWYGNRNDDFYHFRKDGKQKKFKKKKFKKRKRYSDDDRYDYDDD